MVAIVNKFSYTGTVQEVDIPAGTQSIDIYLWGGAAGGGGPDDNPGGPGTGGQHVKHVGYTGVASNIGNQLQVAVGGGGIAAIKTKYKLTAAQEKQLTK